jgi:hypothetical protein
MSALLDTLLDPERRAEAEAADALHAFGRGPSGACYIPDGSYRWPQVPFRTTEAPQRRRVDPPRPSRFGDLRS